MGDYHKSLMILGFGLLIILGSMLVAVSAQESDGEEKGIENEKNPDEIPGEPNEEKQGYTEMFGTFDVNKNSLSGGYVSFNKTERMIENYSFVPEDESIFESIHFSIDVISEVNSRMDGAVYHAEMKGLHVASHNNPTAMLHMIYNGNETVNVSYVLAEGITFGEVHGSILPVNGLSYYAEVSLGTENFTLKGDKINITLSQGEICCFMRDPYQTRSSFQEKVIKSIQEGKIDGELQIMKKEGETVESQNFPYEGKVQMQTKESEMGKMLKIEVQSQEKAGKVLMFRVQGEILDNAETGSVRINFDGEEALRSGNINEIMEGNTNQCKYYIEKDVEGCYQALVYVPEFSTHDIEFVVDGSSDDSSIPGLVIAMIAIFSAVSILTVVMVRRKRTT